MVKKIIIIYLLTIIFNPLKADLKDKIILNLEKTENLTFNFKQKIDRKTETGNCIIEYPKKIYCSYNNFNKKIMVSNGKSLAIKNQRNNQYYLYPLKKTPLELILDKNYLINEIKRLKGRIVDNKYYNFTLSKNNNKINIFFNLKTLNLIGWQTEDVYQNLSITFISSVKINQKIDSKIFIIPRNN